MIKSVRNNLPFLIALLAMFTLSAQEQKTWQSLEQLILRVHVVVFSKDNLFDSQIKAEESQQWRAMVDEVKKEINNLAHGDKKIIDALTFAANLADEILNTNKFIYAALFSPKAKPTQAGLTLAQKDLDSLSQKAEQLEDYSRAMNSSTYWFNSGDKKEGRRILTEVLFLVLQSSILKLNNDFRKKKGSISFIK